MDSGSGGSLQSSSDGDDQEYDSRSESVSSLFASISNPPPQQPPASSFFDPSSHHPQDSSPLSAPNPLFNMTPVWSTRSGPNFYDFVTAPNQSLFGAAAPVVPSQPDQQQGQGVVAKNPKKRTRASRRAPTTVLTTDASNFRQMVQEFTGIPDTLFSTAASPFTRRLDLFAGGTLPLRPSAQRLQFFNSVSPNSTIATPSGGTPSNSDQELAKQPQTLFNLQNSLFTFQSLLQQQQHLPNSLTSNSLDDDQQVNPNLSGFPSSSSSTRWRDLPVGEDGNLGNLEGNNDNSQSGTDQVQDLKLLFTNSRVESVEKSPVTPPLNNERLHRNFHSSTGLGYSSSNSLDHHPVRPCRYHESNLASTTKFSSISGAKTETSSLDASARSSLSESDHSAELSLSNASDMETEWVEQDVPGVYITIGTSSTGGSYLV